MLKTWRRNGIDKLLVKAYGRGIVLSGISAGAICWFTYGCSDSRRFSNPEDASFMRVKGLGLLNLTVSPHHIREKHRDNSLVKLMRKTPGVAVAIDDNSALEIVDNQYRIITSKKGVGARKVYYSKKELHQIKIETNDYRPISDLLQK